MQEHGAHDVDLLALQDLAQPLLGASLLLVSAGTAEGGVEPVLLDGVEEDRQRDVDCAAGARVFDCVIEKIQEQFAQAEFIPQHHCRRGGS